MIAHQTAQNYAVVTVAVSGTVTAGGTPLGGVAFAATNNGRPSGSDQRNALI